LRLNKIDKTLSYSFCDGCQDFELFKDGKQIDFVVKEKMEKMEEFGEGVSDDENNFADYNNKCEKCGYEKAEVIDLGQSYSDEDNVYLLRCGKCGWTERVGKAS